jgi:hypothetical protein
VEGVVPMGVARRGTICSPEGSLCAVTCMTWNAVVLHAHAHGAAAAMVRPRNRFPRSPLFSGAALPLPSP